MKIVTFNIRGDFGVDGANDFCWRKPLIARKLHEEMPDIMGLQEVMPHMAAWLRDALPEYVLVGCGRSERLDGEQATVAFRRDAFGLIGLRTFWLSPTPAIPGSRYPSQSLCPRTATEALLQETATGRVLRVLNTHLDHESPQARRLGLEQILRALDTPEWLPDAPVVLMGDFNADPGSRELQPLTARADYVNAAAGVGGTFHDFRRMAEPSCIDYVFTKGLRVTGAARWQADADGVCLSDHDPVCVTAEWL